MTRRAILHIGTEKTGTTTLQLFLKKNREKLLERGYIYPRFCGDVNHTALAAYAMEPGRKDEIRAAFGVHNHADAEPFRNRLMTAAKLEMSGGQDAIFCNEHCHSRLISVSEVKKLKSFLDSFFDEIKIAVYIRRQDEIATSLYTTRIKSGARQSDLLPKTQSDNPYYNYDVLLRMWEEVFGRENISLRLFNRSELIGGGIICDFLTVWSLGAEDEYLPVDDQNESILPEAQEFLRQMNVHFKQGQGQRPMVSTGPLVTTLVRHYAGRGLQPSRSEARAFYERYKASNQALSQRYFDGRDPLFSEDFDKYPETRASIDLPADDCARIAVRIYEDGQKNVERLEAELLTRDAMLLWERDDRSGAINRMLQAAHRYPWHAPVFRGLAELKMRSQAFADAAAAAERAVALAPKNEEYRFFHGYALKRSEEPAAAEIAFRSVLALNPEHSAARRALSELMAECEHSGLNERKPNDASKQ